MLTDELDFHLPEGLIAQQPSSSRSGSRLMHFRRDDGKVQHQSFTDLPKLLRAGDLLVFNDARVLPARFELRKPTGGRVEGLFLEEVAVGRWKVLLKNAGREGSTYCFAADPGISALDVGPSEQGQHLLELSTNEAAADLLQRVGRMPLPPYIHRDKEQDALDELDRERYQTVFARAPGAVAAPTAALHFTPELLAELRSRQVETAFITLNVGLGTFKPVVSQTLESHPMHRESYEVSPQAARAIQLAKTDGRRIVAIGTTSARVLESQPTEGVVAGAGSTDLLIYPPYHWKYVSALLTNFHLPRSTLIALVAAFVGLDRQRQLYATAISEEYRFFSYGDAMLLE